MSFNSESDCMDVWIIQKEGFQGDLNACLGVGEQLAFEPRIIFNCQIEEFGSINEFLERRTDLPEPDVVIASYQFSTDYMINIKRYFGGRPFLLNLRDPGKSRQCFDLIALPNHAEQIKGNNVVRTPGISHAVTQAKLRNAFGLIPYLPGQLRAAVFVGGNCINLSEETGGGAFSEQYAEVLSDEICDVALSHNMGLYVSNSHRTPKTAWEVIKEHVVQFPHLIFDVTSKSQNPYLSMIATADIIIPTADSMSMCTEACSTGKPVFIAGMNNPNLRSDHSRLANELIDLGLARKLQDFDAEWRPQTKPINPADIVVKCFFSKYRRKPFRDIDLYKRYQVPLQIPL